MKYFRPLVFTVSVLGALSSCRPSSQDNYLYDASTDQVEIQVTEQSKRLALRAGAKKLTKLKQVAITKDVSGTVTPNGSTYVNLNKDDVKIAYDLELTVDTDTSCKNTSTSGVALHNGAKFSVSCVPGPALTDQVRTACKELSTDTGIAEYDEGTDACACLKREKKMLKYADYTGRVSLFKIECKNSGTLENLKTVCTDIKDKLCPTCKVEAEKCECPTKTTLAFAQYLTNVEAFRKDCAGDIKATAPTGSEPGFDVFKKDCTENNGIFVDSISGVEKAACTCQKNNETPQVVTYSDYKQGGAAAIAKVCK